MEAKEHPRAMVGRGAGQEEGVMLKVEALPVAGEGGLLEVLRSLTDSRPRAGYFGAGR